MSILVRVGAVAGAVVGILSVSGCSSWAPSWDWVPSMSMRGPSASLTIESDPPGADAKTSLGASCRTPCMIPVAADREFTVSYVLNGYLPQASAERDARIRELEERSRRLDQTEVFIEAPYRNDQLFKAVTANCKPETILSLATDLTSATEEIRTKNVGEWQQSPTPQLHKRPTVFLLLADKARSPDRRIRPANVH